MTLLDTYRVWVRAAEPHAVERRFVGPAPTPGGCLAMRSRPPPGGHIRVGIEVDVGERMKLLVAQVSHRLREPVRGSA